MKKTPIFRKILFPLLILLFIESLILICGIAGTGILNTIEENEKAIVQKTVDNRKSYLENTMQNSWMNLSYTVDGVNNVMKRYLAENDLTPEQVDDASSKAAPVLSRISEYLISMMRSNHVTGAFVILNGDDLSESISSGVFEDKPGVYFRDMDPTAQGSGDNADLLMECAPISVMHELGIASDSNWDVQFAFGKYADSYKEFYYKPYQMAYENPGEYKWSDMGFWSKPFRLFGKGNTVISYTVPLMLTDGSVYGVLGMDITTEYLSTLLPYQEMNETGNGAYFLAKKGAEEGSYKEVAGDGNLLVKNGYSGEEITINKENYFYYESKLSLYNHNAPFSEDEWVLVGVVPVKLLMAFVDQITISAVIALLVTLALSGIGSVLISYLIQRPIAKLSKEIKEKDTTKAITISDTGIKEIDEITDKLEKLSQNVIEGGRKFSKIIEMASVRVKGFQIDKKNNKLFVTEKFFDIFERYHVDEQNLSVEEFTSAMNILGKNCVEADPYNQKYIFEVGDSLSRRYISLTCSEDEENCYGLAEDVTQALLEKKKIEHERDHDALTNLYNRRAFQRMTEDLFEKSPEQIKIGAFLMLDLDNLKFINDTYGHKYGDRYIKKAAEALDASFPENALYARISGDEFNVFIYGYDNRDKIEEYIKGLKQNLDSMFIALPGNIKQKIRISGGVAWYPKDSASLVELTQYADYTMYIVKKNRKGEIRYFDKESYISPVSVMKNRAALIDLIENKRVKYAFQPIVDTHTGRIFAYEALMRPDTPELKSVQDVLEIARAEGMLNKIEELTWFVSMEAFVKHIENGIIEKDCFLFLNSIPNQRMPLEREESFTAEYRKYVKQIALEMTEEEKLDRDKWEGKQERHRMQGGKIALDDYGTGYNSEKTLLSISPDYIKVDIVIVKDIHLNKDKQEIMSYIVNYAHERGKFIIAEGVETEDEARVVIGLGADYVQGYYFAKPMLVPEGISAKGLRLIRGLNEK